MSAHPKDDGERRGFFALTVARPVALTVAFTTLMVIGIIAYRRIPLQLLPSEFSEPSLNVWVRNPGASAQENEEQIARAIEEQLRTLTGIKEMHSWSEEESVELGIEFDGSVDMDLAKAEVRDRLERARPSMPETVETPVMWSESASSLPVTFFGILLTGDVDRRDYLMEKVVIPRLEAVDGIGRVNIWGVLQDSVRILLDEDKVRALDLNIGDVIARLSSDNFAMPMGEIDDGGREIILRTDMRFHSLDEIAAFPLAGGLRLSDVAEVARVKSVSESVSIIDGGVAYYGMATKDSKSNIVETCQNWERALEELEADPKLAGTMSHMTFFLQGNMIESALGQLRSTATWGGVLAVVVLFVFLRRVRLTLSVALCIPVSALMAIVWEFAVGGSFNVLTMTGITLGIGMLVDNAVVVVENIARLHQEGKNGRAAAVVGTREIALAITLATLTTVVVFLPLIFMTEQPIVRVLFGGIGIPLSISLLASLLISVVFLPVVAARILGRRPRPVEAASRVLAPVAALPVRGIAWLVGGVRLAWHGLVSALFRFGRVSVRVLCPLRFPLAALVVGGTVWRFLQTRRSLGTAEGLERFGVSFGPGSSPPVLGLLAAVAVLLLLVGLPRWRRRPSVGPAAPAVFVPAGTSLVGMIIALNQRLVDWTIAHRLAASGLAIAAFASTAIPASLIEMTPFGEDAVSDSIEFRVHFNAEYTLDESHAQSQPYEEFLESKRDEWGFAHWSNRFDENDARFSLHFEQRRPKEELRSLQNVIMDSLPRISGHTLRFYEENVGRRSQEWLTFDLYGPDYEELTRLGVDAMELLEGVPGIVEISSRLERAPDQIRVEVDRDLAHGLSVDTRSIEQSISYVLRGFPLPRYQEEGRDVPFQIEYDEEEVAGLPTLRDLNVFSPNGLVPLSSVARLAFTKGTNGIFRRNGQASFTIWAKVEDPLQVVPTTDAGYAALQELELPRGYSIGFDESARTRQEDEFKELSRAFMLSVVLVFLLMGILFESVLLPFSVLFTIPFAASGAIWTLWITDTPMDSMGWIGLIILAGVVVNNGIVLIDRMHGLRKEMLTRAEAVTQGCGQRVRPVLMTALTTVCGLLPMILADPPSSDGFDYRALATIVAGGLVASTFFTLWVVPLAYTILDDLAAILTGRFRWWVGGGRVRRAAGRAKPRVRRARELVATTLHLRRAPSAERP